MENLAHKLNLDPETVKQVFINHVKIIDRGQMSWQEFEKIFIQILKPSQPFPKTLLHLFVENIPKIEETHQLVYELAEKYKIGILSDISAEAYARIVFEKLVPQIKFEAEVVSSKVGALKPELKIFEYATEASGVPVTEILFIDDLEQNVEGAKNAGWQAILFEPLNPTKSISQIKKFLAE